jgi:hypothetical protein
MSDPNRSPTLDKPATYQIKVPEQLGRGWENRAGGMSVTAAYDDAGLPVTTLTGTFDQAALHGLLRQIYSLGLPLISVIYVQDQSIPPID